MFQSTAGEYLGLENRVVLSRSIAPLLTFPSPVDTSQVQVSRTPILLKLLITSASWPSVSLFAISGVLPKDEAIVAIKDAIKKTYGKRGEAIVQKNYAAVDQALAHMFKVEVPAEVSSTFTRRDAVPAEAPGPCRVSG